MPKLILRSKHRLMCGDSTNAANVATLMGGAKADVCFTSPPYDQQREYTAETQAVAGDWLSLMRGVFGNLPMSEGGQVLVNLGLVHKDREWVPYWDPWIEWMRAEGWLRFGFYVWDQGSGLPGDWNGRYAPSHEFLFHFTKKPKWPQKTVPKCEASIRDRSGETAMRGDAKSSVKMTSGERSTQTHKIPDSVVRIQRQCGRVTKASHHPAVFPVSLVVFVAKSWPGPLYEPFCGSGTTIIAAEQLGRTCYAMEIAPRYVDIAVRRYEEFTGTKAVRVK